jgi:hypothetical protein
VHAQRLGALVGGSVTICRCMRTVIRGPFAIMCGAAAIRSGAVAIQLRARADVLPSWFGAGCLIAEERRCVTPHSAEIAALGSAIASSRRHESRLTGLVSAHRCGVALVTRSRPSLSRMVVPPSIGAVGDVGVGCFLILVGALLVTIA